MLIRTMNGTLAHNGGAMNRFALQKCSNLALMLFGKLAYSTCYSQYGLISIKL